MRLGEEAEADPKTMGFLQKTGLMGVKYPSVRRAGKRSMKLRLRKEGRREMKEIAERIERVKKDMAEIGEEQRSIREGQRQVRLKCEALASQCRQLRHETDLILEQSAATQQRLAIMFGILRARESRDFQTADRLASLLRKI